MSTCDSQKRASDHLELELETVVIHCLYECLEAKRSSTRAGNALMEESSLSTHSIDLSVSNVVFREILFKTIVVVDVMI